MNLQNRIQLLQELKSYLQNPDEEWEQIVVRSGQVNGWFTPEFIQIAVDNIVDEFLDETKMKEWLSKYNLIEKENPSLIGLVMAGNIPLVGFHDFLCIFVSGHRQAIKLSSKDTLLFTHLLKKMNEFNPAIADVVSIAEQLKNCDAYIATGSNNSATHFEYYFGKYPHIIRRNRTSVAILDGTESEEQLNALADDIHLFFGLGCRNVTKIYVPEGYDFVPFLKACKRYHHFLDHHKYKNNFDYYLTILLMNNQYYMSSESLILIESENLFSPISQLSYSYYQDRTNLMNDLRIHPDIQCIVGEQVAFGAAQCPMLSQYADGVDTMQFLQQL